MQNRTWLVATISTIALAFGMVGPASAVAPKPGTVCPKIGVTRIVDSPTKTVRYSCVKVGKKLLWSKGVSVLKPALPSVSSTPTPTPTASAQPEQAISLENLDPQRVRLAAYREIVREYTSATDYVPPIVFINGPKVPPSAIDSESPGLKRAMRFWASIFQPKKMFVSYIVAKDADWVDAALCSKANNCPDNNPAAHSWGASIKGNPDACTFGEATATNDLVPLLVQCLGPGNDDIQNRQTGPHEYTHLVQQAFTGPFGDSPRWWSEGSAVYFGGVLGVYDSAAFPSSLDYILRYDANSWRRQTLCDTKTVDVQAVVGCFNFSYLRGAPVPRDQLWQISSTSYYPGNLVTEAMVAVYGVPKIKEFMKAVRVGNFDQAFQETFDISVDEFYPKVAKYVVAMYESGR